VLAGGFQQSSLGSMVLRDLYSTDVDEVESDDESNGDVVW
jgi:hypothetical protein